MKLPWYQRPADEIAFEEANDILADLEQRNHFPKQFQILVHSIQERLDDLKIKSKAANPLAWFQPSYEQHLKLNCWIYGINYVVDFDANRIGKTAGGIVNALMWIIPNDPAWIMFTPHTDHKNRTYRTIPRPTIHTLEVIRRILGERELKGDPVKPLTDPNNARCYEAIKHLLEDTKSQKPNPTKRTIWAGGPDNDFQEEIVMPEWVKWTPPGLMTKHSPYEHIIEITTDTPPPLSRTTPQTKNTIIFKSYDSKDTKWSGAAVDAILLTEGPPKEVFNEVRQRYKSPAFASWDYTPYEPRNTATKSALAHKVFQGKEQLPLTPFIFSGFGIVDAPTYILAADKKADLERMWAKSPQGAARIHGNFYSSSPVVLRNYNENIHAIPHDLQWLRDFYKGKQLPLFRAVDPGWGHVTAAAWMALAPDGTKWIYQVYSCEQRSIEERCDDIITLSGNKRIQHPKSKDRWLELVENPLNQIRLTTIDYHTFKTDENTKRPFAENYIKHGLVVRPSITFGPKERGTMLNDLLMPQQHFPHPIARKPPGSKIYFLTQGHGVAAALQKLQNVFWQTFEKGEKRGLTKDAIQDIDDDELDAVCYVSLPTYNYQSLILGHANSIHSGRSADDARLSFKDYIQSPSESSRIHSSP